MSQQIFILFLAIVFITLTHGATIPKKTEKKPEERYRQGLEKSVETHDEYPPEGPAPDYPLRKGEAQKLEFNVENDNNHIDPNKDCDDCPDGPNITHIDQKEKKIDLESGEYDSKEMIMLNGKGTRGLEAGDVFTAQEMLPIAVKLMDRAKSDGKGKGIVTSQTNPKSLADNLFEKYFWKNCEIHLLNGETVVSQADDWCNLVETTDEQKDEDISGLDALQALALSGTVSTERSREKYIGPETDLEERGKVELPDFKEIATRRKSLYRLLTKPLYNKIRRVPRRRGNDSPVDYRKANRAKKRKLNVNPQRRILAKEIKKPRGQKGQPKKLNKIERQGQLLSEKKRKTPNKINCASKTKRFCRWKYGCKNQLVLETCKLSMDCSEAAKSKDYLGIELLPNEKRENLAMLRSWAGVDVIDTEVEKILENRYNQQIYSKLGNIQRSENIADYFNNLMHFQTHGYENEVAGPTTPMFNDNAYEDSKNSDSRQDPDTLANGSGEDGDRYDQQNPDTQASRLRGEKPKTIVMQLNNEAQKPGGGQEQAEEAAETSIIAETEAAKETTESEQKQEVAAAELAKSEIEMRRKFLSDHKTTSDKLKRI